MGRTHGNDRPAGFDMTRHIILLLGSLIVSTLVMSSTDSSAAGRCKPGQISATGTATTKTTAQRNARISLMSKLNRRYPGDARSRIRGRIGYACKNPLLWSCRASIHICG